MEIGLLAWGTTLELSQTAGTFGPDNVPFINGTLNATDIAGEITELSSVCALVIAEGSNYGQCKSCTLGALSGGKK